MRIGIDLGGTKTEIIALDDSGHECYRKRVPTIQDNYTATLQTIITLIEEAESQLAIKASVGIGIPGAISKQSGLVKNANSTWLIGQPLKQDLEQALSREIRIENDANCFTVSEAVDGAAKDYPVVFGVIIGTGTGGGIAFNGKSISGINSIAGEWGHNPLPWLTNNDNEMACYCGKKGCIETFLSGPGLVKHCHADGLMVANVEELVQLAETGNTHALSLLERYYEWLAKGLASVINIIDPDVIVLGGGLSNIAQLYSEVPKRLSNYVFSDQVTTQICKAKYGDSSGVRGAAWLWS